jgi:NADPH:quinone reductase-like Zn-dependent oxidoreductase
MHKMLAPDGTYAEYAIALASTTFKVPERVLFEGAFSFLFRDV